MTSGFKKYLFMVFIAVLMVAGAGFILFNFFVPRYYIGIMPYMLIFFALVSILSFNYQLSLSKKGTGQFTRGTMVLTFLKLVLYSGCAVGYIAARPANAIPFVISLFILYFLFSFIEISQITRLVRNKKE